MSNLIDNLYTIVGLLRGLNLVYHDLHLNANGENYYGDHLLFQRLYAGEGVFNPIDEIDGVMERIVGVTHREVSLMRILGIMNEVLANYVKTRRYEEKIRYAYELELRLQEVITDAEESEKPENLDGGISNLIQGVQDTHQGIMYLLDRRLS